MIQTTRERFAARVLVLDEQGRVLAIKGHDADKPERQWWFTIGGGIEQGETTRTAAVRELFEETGIKIIETDLIGPVLQRSAIFDFESEHVLQHEEFFLTYVSSQTPLSREGWTDLEKSFVDDLAWLTPHQLRTAGIEVFPAELAQIVENLAQKWDGKIAQLDTQNTKAHLKK